MTNTHWLEREIHRAAALAESIRCTRVALDDLQSIQRAQVAVGTEPGCYLPEEMMETLDTLFKKTSLWERKIRLKTKMRRTFITGWQPREMVLINGKS